ncbi:MAG: hypothetical protein HYV63_34745, partial [Candidatus Schekmanbacteria bacterium]|nr:hypothetical protein [Candidatus Schekmanbacteria bacterium]
AESNVVAARAADTVEIWNIDLDLKVESVAQPLPSLSGLKLSGSVRRHGAWNVQIYDGSPAWHKHEDGGDWLRVTTEPALFGYALGGDEVVAVTTPDDGRIYKAWFYPGKPVRFVAHLERDRADLLSGVAELEPPLDLASGTLTVLRMQEPDGSRSHECYDFADPLVATGFGAKLEADRSISGFSGESTVTTPFDKSAGATTTTATKQRVPATWRAWHAWLQNGPPPGYLPEGDIANPGAPAGSTLTFGIAVKPTFALSKAKLELAFATSRFPGIAGNWPLGSVPANQDDMIFTLVTAGAQTTAATTTPWAAPWVDPFAAGVHSFFNDGRTAYWTATYDHVAPKAPKDVVQFTAQSTDFGAKGFFAARWTPDYAATPIPIGLDPLAPPATDADKVMQIPPTRPGEAIPDGNWITPLRAGAPRLAIDPLADQDIDRYARISLPGDGLVAYDEFRGFVFGTSNPPPHVRTDPKNKNLFVLVEADLGGFQLGYGSATDIALVSRVVPNGTDVTPWLAVNPHGAVQSGQLQHAAWLKTLTFVMPREYYWGMTDRADSPGRSGPSKVAIDQIRLDTKPAPPAFQDYLIRNIAAHELLHASSIDDHGHPEQCPVDPPQQALECALREEAGGDRCTLRAPAWAVYQANHAGSPPDYSHVTVDYELCGPASQDKDQGKLDIKDW